MPTCNPVFITIRNCTSASSLLLLAVHHVLDRVVVNAPDIRSVAAGKNESHGDAAVHACVDDETVALLELLQRQTQEVEPDLPCLSGKGRFPERRKPGPV